MQPLTAASRSRDNRSKQLLDLATAQNKRQAFNAFGGRQVGGVMQPMAPAMPRVAQPTSAIGGMFSANKPYQPTNIDADFAAKNLMMNPPDGHTFMTFRPDNQMQAMSRKARFGTKGTLGGTLVGNTAQTDGSARRRAINALMQDPEALANMKLEDLDGDALAEEFGGNVGDLSRLLTAARAKSARTKKVDGRKRGVHARAAGRMYQRDGLPPMMAKLFGLADANPENQQLQDVRNFGPQGAAQLAQGRAALVAREPDPRIRSFHHGFTGSGRSDGQGPRLAARRAARRSVGSTA